VKHELELIAESRCFGGWNRRYRHRSEALDCDMVFTVYLPPAAETGSVPALWWLSGLTCTDENFSHKAGAQRVAGELGIALVVPDTSPRGVDLPGQDDDYDFGSGAGFYLNASQDPWKRHYRMYDYVVSELPEQVTRVLPVDRRFAVSGHSMGGHGALICAIRNPDRYRSVSAFAPICNPSRSAWGEKAFSGYLGDDRETWSDWDACELIGSLGCRHSLLIDQGEADEFLAAGQLRPEALETACIRAGVECTLRRQPGYDHSYFFIATFIEDHLRYHARHLFLD